MLAFPPGMGLAGPVAGRPADRCGDPPVAVIGAALTAAGLLLLVPLGVTGRRCTWPGGWRWPSLGMGLNGSPAQALVMGAAPADRTATVGSSVPLARSLGIALGPAPAVVARGLAGGDDGVTPGLTLAAAAACIAVPLLALPGRSPALAKEMSTDEAPAAHHP
ncbi:hypothetical protein ACQ4WX_03575 [Streptomyces lasalocidi]